MDWYVFSDSMFTLSSFQFPKAELLWGCTECPQNMVHLCPLGNDSTTLSKVNFGVHSSSLDGFPSTQLLCRCLPGVFIHYYPGIPFACLWWCFLFPVSHNFHFLGLLPLFGGVSSSSFLRSGAWEVNTFSDFEYLKIILFYNLIWLIVFLGIEL